MAVTHTLYGPFLNNLAGGIYGALNSTQPIKVMLMTSAHSFTQDHQYWSQVSANEQSTATVGSTSYITGGKTLNVKSLAYATRITTLSASSFTSFSTAGDIIGFFAVAAASSYLVSCVNFGGKQQSAAGEFKINWTDAKILTMTVAAT